MSDQSPAGPQQVLVADLGGTNARFGLVGPDGALRRHAKLRSDDYPGPAEAASDYLRGLAEDDRPRIGVFAVASPVTGDRIAMTNRSWTFSVEQTRSVLGLDRLEAINDFAALALSLPVLGQEDLRPIKSGERPAGAPMAVLGPGTGLGVAGLVPAAGRWWPVETEGGHRDLAVAEEREWRIHEALRRRTGHVSCEHVLSGPGLVNLTTAIRDLQEAPPEEPTPDSLSPAEVVERAGSDPDSPEAEAVRLFSNWLGAMAGDLALTLGARGGIFLGGGILPKMGRLFDEEGFRSRFLAKGRFREYLLPVPVDLVLHPTRAAMIGAARLLDLDA